LAGPNLQENIMHYSKPTSCRKEQSVPALNYLAAVLLGLSFLHANSASGGTVLFDTSKIARGSWHHVGLLAALDTINQPAGAFFVSGGNYQLETVTVELQRSNLLVGGTSDDYQIRIWDDNAGVPGNLLDSINVHDSSNAFGLVTLDSISRPILDAGITYWVSVALPEVMMEGGWFMTYQLASPPRVRAVAIAESGSVSASWIEVSSTTSLIFQVTGTPIPEPHAACLAMYGIVLWSACRIPNNISD